MRKFLRAPLRWLSAAFRGGISMASEEAARLFGYFRPTLSGVVVTDKSALESPEFFAGVRNIAEDLATLPLIVYRRTGDRNRERDQDHHLYDILHDQPNEEMDRVQFVEMMQAWLMIRRNAYAEIQRNGAGRVVGLWPIPPSRVYVQRADGELYYRVTLPYGEKDPRTGLPYTILERSQMFHIKAFALDGVCGESAIEMHREAIGVSLALDMYSGAFFGNDSTPGGVYEVPGVLTDEAYKRLKDELVQPHQGLDRKHRAALLEQGTKFHETSVPNDKAQFLESKRYSAEQMARINRVPPHKIGELSHATFSNIEHQGIDYVVSSIRPYAVRWEGAIRSQLFTKADRKTHFAEFLIDALLRGDSLSRASALAILRQNGIINGDQWRQLEGMNEIEDGSGKRYLVNGNMIPIDQAGAVKVAPGGEPPAEEPDEDEPDDEDEARRVFAPLFRAACEATIAKEAAAISKAVEREFRAKGFKAFEVWLLDFYGKHGASIMRSFVPLAVSVGEAIRGPAGPDLGEWAEGYARSVAAARLKAATDEIRGIVTAGSPAIPVLMITLKGWTQNEPAAMAKREAGAMIDSLRRYLAKNQGIAA